MQKLVLIVLAVAILVTGVAVLSGCGDDQLPTGAVATVGDRVVTKAQFDAVMAQYQAQYEAQAGQPGATSFPEVGSPEYDRIAAQAVQSLVLGELVRHEAKRRHLVVGDDELAEAITQTEAAQGGRKALDELLEQFGMSRDDLRVLLTTQLLEGKVGPLVTADSQPTEQEIRDYFDAHRAEFDQPESRKTRHILVDDKATADKLFALLSADPGDANWEELAKQYTTDTGGRLTGGDLGSVTQGQMVKPFEDAVFGAQKGEVVGPVKTEYGWHVLQVTDVTPAVEADFDKVRADIAQQLGSESIQQAWQAWLDGAMDDVVYAPGFDPDELAPSPAPGTTTQP